MASPNLSIIIEPAESGRIVYLAMAPKTAGGPRLGQLSLTLEITNNETIHVTVANVELSFQGSPAIAPASYPPKKLTVVAPCTSMSCIPVTWFFQTADSVLLPQPAPPTVKVAVKCDEFADP